MTLYTHLNFGENCEEAFHFYEKHLDGKITMMMKKSQLPPLWCETAISGKARWPCR